ncbi:MAG: hypothetical protein SVT56_12615, partial [Chloroflexota bacterium]|nr:hypothetical protein [Chloroflexota bacterium]
MPPKPARTMIVSKYGSIPINWWGILSVPMNWSWVCMALAKPNSNAAAQDTHLLDFRPVLRHREAMAYVLAYAVHMWE